MCQEEKELKQILLLLLHAPPQEILESNYIMAIISGDFSSREETGNNLDENVFKSITENYPNGLILINNSNSSISFTNSKADEFLTTIKIDEDEEDENQNKKNIKNKSKNKQKNGSIEKVIPKEIVLGQTHFTLNNRSLNATYTKIDSAKTLVTLTDTSSIQKLEVEIDKETKRKADLISQFMPPILTPKFMSNQDQGVSFSVQSVTIAMISLGLESRDEKSIQIFNEVHSFFVSRIVEKNYQTIESIEILGDTFMVIGGLFDEVNQAERHAQEVIRFTLDAIKKIKLIKEKFNLNNNATLCGVATGGPVSGGIIELDAPIFEVCGDVVDLADEMMALGMPNVIHTTRAVYELIYGRDFEIKERGELPIPNFGTVVTYIVSDSEQS